MHEHKEDNMEQTKKKSLNIGTILFLVIALLYIPNIISVIQLIGYGVFGIGSIMPIAIFVVTILFAVSLSNENNPQMPKIYSLIIFLLYALNFLLSIPSLLSAFVSFSIIEIFSYLSALFNVLCYLSIFLFYQKTNGEDKGKIKNLFAFSLVGMAFCIFSDIVSFIYGNASLIAIVYMLCGILAFAVLSIYSLSDMRVPVSEGKDKLKKVRNGAIAVVVVFALIFGITSLISNGGSKQYNAEEADKNNDGNVTQQEFQDLVEEFMDDHGY
jgi:hypothetical protein